YEVLHPLNSHGRKFHRPRRKFRRRRPHKLMIGHPTLLSTIPAWIVPLSLARRTAGPRASYDAAECCSALCSPRRAKNDQRLSSARNSALDMPPSKRGRSAEELRSRIASAVYLGTTKLPVLGGRHTLVLSVKRVRWITLKHEPAVLARRGSVAPLRICRLCAAISQRFLHPGRSWWTGPPGV